MDKQSKETLARVSLALSRVNTELACTLVYGTMSDRQRERLRVLESEIRPYALAVGIVPELDVILDYWEQQDSQMGG